MSDSVKVKNKDYKTITKEFRELLVNCHLSDLITSPSLIFHCLCDSFHLMMTRMSDMTMMMIPMILGLMVVCSVAVKCISKLLYEYFSRNDHLKSCLIHIPSRILVGSEPGFPSEGGYIVVTRRITSCL